MADYEVAVIGAGPGGIAAAYMLGQKGRFARKSPVSNYEFAPAAAPAVASPTEKAQIT